MWPGFWVPQSDLLHHRSLRQGTPVLHVPKQTHLAKLLFRMKMFPIPVVERVGIFGLPPWAEGHAQGRSLLAPFVWHGSQRNRDVVPLFSYDDFVVPVGCQP